MQGRDADAAATPSFFLLQPQMQCLEPQQPDCNDEAVTRQTEDGRMLRVNTGHVKGPRSAAPALHHLSFHCYVRK